MNKEEINDLIRDRRKVSISFLLLLFYLSCNKISWSPDRYNDDPMLRNFPRVRESAEKGLNISTSNNKFAELRRELEANPTSINNRFVSSRGVYQKAEEIIKIAKKSLLKSRKSMHNQKEASRIELIRKSEMNQTRVHDLVQEAFNRLNELLHTYNTRTPRYVTLPEHAEFFSLTYSCDAILQLLPPQLRFPIIDSFLTRSNIAGVENGVPVIPNDPSFYAGHNFSLVIRDFHSREYPILTSEAQRGEATWVVPESVRNEAEVNAILHEFQMEELERQQAGRGAAQRRFEEGDTGFEVKKKSLYKVCKTREANQRCCSIQLYCSKACSALDWPCHKNECTNSRRGRQKLEFEGAKFTAKSAEFTNSAETIQLEGAKTDEDILTSSHLSESMASLELPGSDTLSHRMLQEIEDESVAKAIAASLDNVSSSSRLGTSDASAARFLPDDPEEAGCEPRPAPDAIRGMQAAIQRLSGSISVETKPICTFC